MEQSSCQQAAGPGRSACPGPTIEDWAQQPGEGACQVMKRFPFFSAWESKAWGSPEREGKSFLPEIAYD